MSLEQRRLRALGDPVVGDGYRGFEDECPAVNEQAMVVLGAPLAFWGFSWSE